MKTAEATVIIPTLGTASRFSLLRRAIRSVANQSGLRTTPLVVLNGDQAADEVVRYLHACKDIRLLEIPDAGVSRARAAGVRACDTGYFGFLDDDDELLPTCMQTRVAALSSDPELCMVATDGYYETGGVQTASNPHFMAYPTDPALAIVEYAWLNSASAAFSATNATADDFDTLPDILEWTFLGLRWCLAGKKLLRLPHPSFVIHRHQTEHVTLGERYMLETPNVLRRMFDLNPPLHIKHLLEAKYASALHTIADHMLRKGDLSEALKYHLRSLVHRGGLKYLTFSRRILLQSLRA